MRKSKVSTHVDAAGSYESEVFSCDQPKRIVICAHGNGVRRWDGEDFFYKVADHYPDHAFYLVDQTQVIEDGCKLIDLSLMVERVQSLVRQATSDHPGVPVTVLAHSMGCGVSSLLDTRDIRQMILVTPAGGDVLKLMIDRYGEGIVSGGLIRTSDGLNKLISKEYVDSVGGVIWEEKYTQLLENFKEVYVFEAGEDDIISEDRRAPLRTIPFKQYTVIPGATHNLHGAALNKLFLEIDTIL